MVIINCPRPPPSTLAFFTLLLPPNLPFLLMFSLLSTLLSTLFPHFLSTLLSNIYSPSNLLFHTYNTISSTQKFTHYPYSPPFQIFYTYIPTSYLPPSTTPHTLHPILYIGYLFQPLSTLNHFSFSFSPPSSHSLYIFRPSRSTTFLNFASISTT